MNAEQTAARVYQYVGVNPEHPGEIMTRLFIDGEDSGVVVSATPLDLRIFTEHFGYELDMSRAPHAVEQQSRGQSG